MMWYEISGIPKYRINHLGQIMSLQGESPVILKYKEQVRLIVEGRYVTYSTQALLDFALTGTPLQGSVHPESARGSCDKGHKFTPENTMRRKGKNGDIRKCRRCHNDAVNRYRRSRRASDARESPATA